MGIEAGKFTSPKLCACAHAFTYTHMHSVTTYTHACYSKQDKSTPSPMMYEAFVTHIKRYLAPIYLFAILIAVN